MRNVEYQVENKKGDPVPNVEVRLIEQHVSGDKSAKICGGNGCSNKADKDDFKAGQFHDEGGWPTLLFVEFITTEGAPPLRGLQGWEPLTYTSRT